MSSALAAALATPAHSLASRPARRFGAPARRGWTIPARVGRSGINRLTGEPEWVEVSDASAAIADAQEQQAIFFNLTCAHSKLGDADAALAALEAALRAGYCSAQLYGFSKANEDYERLMRDEDLANARADERFKALVDKYNVEPSELQLQLDPSQSVIGRAMKMWASKK